MYRNEASYNRGGKSYIGVKTNRVGCSPISFLFFLILIVIIVALLLVALVYASGYNDWKNSFLLEADSRYLVMMEDLDRREESEITQKIELFNSSRDDVDFVEFTPREVAILLGESMEDSLPSGMVLDQVYIKPYERRWLIYFKTSAGDLSFPWVGVELTKDDIQTARLNISSVYIGDADLADYKISFLAENLDEGYSEALNLVNESSITAREIENIELGTDMLILKGRKRIDLDEPI